jgi:hypothetical protein
MTQSGDLMRNIAVTVAKSEHAGAGIIALVFWGQQ